MLLWSLNFFNSLPQLAERTTFLYYQYMTYISEITVKSDIEAASGQLHRHCTFLYVFDTFVSFHTISMLSMQCIPQTFCVCVPSFCNGVLCSDVPTNAMLWNQTKWIVTQFLNLKNFSNSQNSLTSHIIFYHKFELHPLSDETNCIDLHKLWTIRVLPYCFFTSSPQWDVELLANCIILHNKICLEGDMLTYSSGLSWSKHSASAHVITG